MNGKQSHDTGRSALTRLPAFIFLAAHVAFIALAMMPRRAAFAAGF
jgi:hypothetical protein